MEKIDYIKQAKELDRKSLEEAFVRLNKNEDYLMGIFNKDSQTRVINQKLEKIFQDKDGIRKIINAMSIIGLSSSQTEKIIREQQVIEIERIKKDGKN